MLKLEKTVLSQYANSPILMQLIENMNEWIDPRVNILQFYKLVWNINTAIGFGLDIWGRILGISRVIPIPGTNGSFGFDNPDRPPDWQNFGSQEGSTAWGGPFYSGQSNTGGYTLNDTAYRTLLLTKALANIVATNAPSLNALVRNLFPGRGACYTVDLGNMAMRYVFDFALSSIEFAILVYSGVLPHPAGVQVSVLVVAEDYFGFREAGDGAEPFGSGVFYLPS